jgi:hypothetical protein
MCPIEFHTQPELLNRIPHPYPASQHVPEWLKEMPLDFEHGGTLKRCPPFLAAMTAGYIIPAPADARVIMSGEGIIELRAKIDAQGWHFPYLSTHFPAQVAGAPFAAARIVKFENPWIIVTPPDYVCLITAPVNRFEIPFAALTGIVETGTYYREIHLPMACAMQPATSYEMLRGAPMIQVIPIRREEWVAHVKLIDPTRRAEQEEMFQSSPHFYKERFWQKASFS